MNENKIVLITGASRGIGAGIATHMAKLGYTIVGTATSEESLASFNSAMSEINAKYYGVVLDVNNNNMINNVFAEVNEKFNSGIDILVNNAGITKDGLFIKMKEENWDKVIATNLTGTFNVTKAAIRSMVKAKWGRVINITSVVATSGNPGQTNYCAAKAGILGLTKSLALELASANRDITVNAVSPGFITTDMTNALTKEQQQAVLSQVPMQRMGLPSDIAAAVAYLASSDASYVTGQTLHINGGLLMV